MRPLLRLIAVPLVLAALAGPAAAQTADDLFDAGSLRELRLVLHSSDWSALKATFQENTFYPADVTWSGTTLRNAAVRSRGLGSRSATKPGLLLRFDRYVRDGTFLGQTSLVLDNLTQDPSAMKEVLAMQLFRRMGLPAPREAFVRLYVNNAYLGLYAVVEDIAAPFLQRTLGESAGTLYEYDWTFDYTFDYRGSTLDNYVMFKPQTNTTQSTFDLYSPIESLVRVVNQATDEGFEAAVAPYLDLQAVARHLAVENFISDDDGWLGNWGMNNFYLYRRASGGRFQIIAWDKDYTFWRPDNDIFLRVDANVLARRALALPPVWQAYVDALGEAADSASEGQEGGDRSTGWLAREIERLYGLVRDAVVDDPVKPYSIDEFDQAVAGLRTFAAGRGPFVRCAVANLSRDPQPCR